MSRYQQHLHVPCDPAFSSQHRHRPSSPADEEEGISHFNFPNSSSSTPTTTMPTIEEQLAAFQQLAATQQKQLEDANNFARQQQSYLEESRTQLHQAQQTVNFSRVRFSFWFFSPRSKDLIDSVVLIKDLGKDLNFRFTLSVKDIVFLYVYKLYQCIGVNIDNCISTSSGGELTASQTASTNSTAKGLIYVFQNRRSSSAAAHAFNRLSNGQFLMDCHKN